MSSLSLYWIKDEKTKIPSLVGEGGARLTKVGKRKDNNILSLEGLGSRLELGRFSGCLSDTSKCAPGFTISLWLRVRNIANRLQYIVGNRPLGNNEEGFSLSRSEQGLMNISFVSKNRHVYMMYRADPDKWYHHSITWDGGPGINVTLNGRVLLKKKISDKRKRRNIVESFHAENGNIDESTSHRARRAAMSSLLLTLGRSGYSIDSDYDDVAVWNRILNPAEILAVYKGSLSKFIFVCC